jgi:hypothetical protein
MNVADDQPRLIAPHGARRYTPVARYDCDDQPDEANGELAAHAGIPFAWKKTLSCRSMKPPYLAGISSIGALDGALAVSNSDALLRKKLLLAYRVIRAKLPTKP